MKVLRTPDERFEGLPGFDFAPHYAEVPDGDGGTLRMHYLDEGPADGPIVLLMHGEPSWCYLYRTMIPVLVDAGLRCIAPDLVGFGRSDKPAERDDYSYARHVEWVRSLLFDELDLRDITFFGQDWGGLVGLRVVAEHPDRFARVAIGNTGLPTGHEPMSDAFLGWQTFSQTTPDFDLGAIISMGVVNPLPAEVVAAYNAPFPDDSYKAGARIFPTLVPTRPDDPATSANIAAREVLAAWDKPFLTLFSDSDPITGGGERWFQDHVAGAAGQPHTTITGGGHFLQEDQGPEIARLLATFVAADG
ncbi:haloalkane dehalogenase [Nocardioides sp. CN2-186]|uniref:haloalkane dehalogenase n=1 Tax=Nocardioides tweenelious TaxID=3156607 RepID=UPI0032B49805